MTTLVETIAGWCTELAPSDVPDRVADLARAQRRSVLGGVAASADDAAGERVVRAVRSWAGKGDAPLVGSPGEAVRAEDAIYAAAALSIALDFDDYLCFGHTGHSAALVPTLLAAETGAPGAEQLAAQIAANEVEARLGGACLVGPLNGQLWSQIHAAGAAVAAGRLLELDAGRLAHALAIALYQPTRATVPGFMAPDSKLLTAAEPTVQGVRAARLAANGVTGPLDALEHPEGVLSAFADAPLPGMFSGLGNGWAAHTLCVKPYPGCAYVDTAVDALLHLGPPPADEVESVAVTAGALTCEMDALSAPYAGEAVTPVTMTFSVPWTAAATLLAGELTPRQANAQWLAEHRDELVELARRVSVTHDWSLTTASARAFAPLLPPRSLVRDAGGTKIASGLRRARKRHPGIVRGLRDLGGLTTALREARVGDLPERLWGPSALESFAITFPAEVRVRLRSGTERVARADVPRGGAGHPTEGPVEVAREKLATCGPTLWGSDGTAAIDRAVAADDDGLWKLLAGP